MAIFTKSNNTKIAYGTYLDVCFRCGQKEGLSLSEARIKYENKLLYKPVYHITNELCLCGECIKELNEEVINFKGNKDEVQL